MVVESRLRHLCSMIEEGAHARIILSATPQRIKVKVVVTQSVGSMVSSLAIGALRALIETAKIAKVIDRGHKHSNGDSEVCFWIEAAAVPTTSASTASARPTAASPPALATRPSVPTAAVSPSHVPKEMVLDVDMMGSEAAGSTTFNGTV